MADADVTLLQAMDVVDNTKGTLRLLRSTFGKNSINRMAKDSMLQTPVIADTSIDSQTLSVINKCIERRTAAILMSVFSLNPYVSLKKFGSIGGYIRTFYDNEKSPIALPTTDSDINLNDIPEDSVSVMEASILEEGFFKVDPQVEFEYLIGTESALNDTAINDIYNSAAINVSRLERMVSGMEANDKYSVGDQYSRSLANHEGNDGLGDAVTAAAANAQDHVKATGLHGNTVPRSGGKQGGGQSAKIEKVESSFEPTLLNVNFAVQSPDSKAVTNQSVVIGMQSVMRGLRYNDIVDTLTIAAKGSVEAFKMVRYLTGERKLSDFFLGIADAKEIARPKTIGGRVLANLRRRKHDSTFKKFSGGAKPLPITWLVVSQAAVDEVNSKTGIDLGQPYFAVKMMNEYYFLGFVIVDESMGSVKIILDGDNAFTDTTLRALTNTNKQKYDLDLNDIKTVQGIMSGKL